MALAFEHPFTVPATAIDENDHANNVEYVRWMQDVAKAHAESCGGAAAVRAIGAAWVVRSHHIEYLKPVHAGDELIVRTWVSRFDRVTSIRCYELLLAASNALAARGETKWVLIDVKSGRPRAVPNDVVECFGSWATDRERASANE